MGWTKYLFLNTTAGPAGTNANAWGNISPTSSVFGGNDSNFYGNGVEQISYIWHDVPGLQKFGSYTGNSNANGSYVELGFRPALLWLKRTDAAGNWVILDTKRNSSNPVTTSLYADTSDKDYAPGQDWVLTYFLVDLKYAQLTEKLMLGLTSTVHGQKHHHLTCMVDSPTQDNINK